VGCADGALLKLAAKSVLLLAFQEKSWERSTLGPVLGEALGVYSLEGRIGCFFTELSPSEVGDRARTKLGVLLGETPQPEWTGHSATPLGEELGRALGDRWGGGQH
jgi:hypothetical protein